MNKKGATAANCCCAEDETVACCHVDGTCEDLTVDDCLSAGGTPFGAGTSCAGTSCQPVGPCCIDLECHELTEDDCNNAGGLYLGDDGQCAGELCETCGGFGVLCDDSIRVSGFMSSTECTSGTVEGCSVTTFIDVPRVGPARWQYLTTGSESAGPHEGTCFECEVSTPGGGGCEWGGVTMSATIFCDEIDAATGLPLWRMTGALKIYKPLTFACSGGSAPRCSTCRLIQGTDVLGAALCPSGSIVITDFGGVSATFTVEAA